MRNEVTRTFVVLNPVAGRAKGQENRQILERYFENHPGTVEFYETIGNEDLVAVVSAALERACNLVVVVGGDGTLAGVAGALVHTTVPLGIVPAGTGNGLARGLGIPLDSNKAVALLVDQHKLRTIDVMQVQDRIFLLNVGVGLSAQAVSQIAPEVKQRLGRSIYVWEIVKQLIGYQPRRFVLTVDGHRHRLRAAEVLIANGLDIYTPRLDWGPAERFYDGKLDAYLIRAQSVIDYLVLAGSILLRRGNRRSNRHLRYFAVHESIEVDAYQTLPVEVDGDTIARTPIRVQILPRALQVIVPPA
ncbi:MAG TPA: diacylglycerol kinase family protein [Anaerolineae bacterium]